MGTPTHIVIANVAHVYEVVWLLMMALSGPSRARVRDPDRQGYCSQPAPKLS